MKKGWILFICIVRQQMHLFYPAAEFKAGGDVLQSQAIDWSQWEGQEAERQVREVVRLLMNTDGSLDFSSPIPQGTQLLQCSVSGGLWAIVRV